ncbi:hypothetical protein [Desulfocastanea catecholica]
MRKLLGVVSDNAAELVTETTGAFLPWVRSIRKAGEYVEQEVDLATAARLKELKELDEV